PHLPSLPPRLAFLPHPPPPPPPTYALSLHDALPIWLRRRRSGPGLGGLGASRGRRRVRLHRHAHRVLNAHGVDGGYRSPLLAPLDRKSTRLNSSHVSISYAVFCLKKKKKI